ESAMSPDTEHQKQQIDHKIVGGVAWAASAKWLRQVFLSTWVIVAARILDPADFGIVELSSISFVLTNLLAEFGVGTAVLQMRELDRRVLGQLHSFSVIASTV